MKAIFIQAVSLFHSERKEPENEELPLVDLARKCANTVFAASANTIVGDKELCAREFMAHCRENFGYEIGKALAEVKEPEEVECVA